MPKYDGTGPKGMGPGTGRGLGACCFGACGFGPCRLGLNCRKRFGSNRGLGKYFGWDQPQTQEDQKKALSEYKKALEEELEDVKKEEEELEKQA